MKTSLIFLLGIGMGTVLGILVAPEAGKITRRKIRDEADKFIDNALAKKQQQELLNDETVDTANADVDVVVVTEESRYTI
jgi:gas vesicle protein